MVCIVDNSECDLKVSRVQLKLKREIVLFCDYDEYYKESGTVAKVQVNGLMPNTTEEKIVTLDLGYMPT